MDCEPARISFSIEPHSCILRLNGILGVETVEELLQTALELWAYRKDVLVDWSGATQLDASTAQVLLSLRGCLREQAKSLAIGAEIPPAIQQWLRTAGLWEILGEVAA